MFCKWCGLESETSDICSWCRRPFGASASPATMDEPETSETSSIEADNKVEKSVSIPDVLPSKNGAFMLGDFEEEDEFSPFPFTPAPPVVKQSNTPDPTATKNATPAAPPIRNAVTESKAPPIKPAPHSAPPNQNPPGMQAIPIKQSSGIVPPPLIPIIRPQSGQRQTLPPVSQPVAPASTRSNPPVPLPLANRQSGQVPADVPLKPQRMPVSNLQKDTPPPSAQDLSRPTKMLLGENLAEESEPTIGAVPTRQAQPKVEQPAARSMSTPTATMSMGKPVYCRWCGMQSDDPNICSWCRRDLRQLASSHTAPVRVNTTHTFNNKKKTDTKTNGVAVKSQPAQPTKPDKPASKPVSPVPVLAGAAPQIGTFQAQKSKYYTDKVMDPISGAHYDPDTGKPVDTTPVIVLEDDVNTERKTMARNVGIYLIYLALLTGISFVASKGLPYLLILGISNFAAGIAMPLLRIVPFGEDDSDDVALALALILILGPFVGSILYGIVGFMKQDANPAIVGVFISYIVLRIGLDVAFSFPVISGMMPFTKMNNNIIMGFGAQWMCLATIAGWYAAGVFHKPNE